MEKRWRIPNRIKECREKAEKSQQEVADLLSTSKGSYQNIERGYREPSSTLGIRLAQILGVDITDLYKKEALIAAEERRRIGSHARVKAKARKGKGKAKKK